MSNIVERIRQRLIRETLIKKKITVGTEPYHCSSCSCSGCRMDINKCCCDSNDIHRILDEFSREFDPQPE